MQETTAIKVKPKAHIAPGWGKGFFKPAAMQRGHFSGDSHSPQHHSTHAPAGQ